MESIANREQNSLIDTRSQSMSDLLTSWAAFIDASPKTVATYTRAVKQLVMYFTRNGITAPTKADILEYKADLLRTGHKPTTAAAYLAAVRQFFKWTEEAGLYPDIAKNVKGVRINPSHKKDALNKSQVKALLAVPDRNTVHGQRDYAILLLMVTCGLRTVEVIRADVKDIRGAGDNTALYVQGKGRTEKDEAVILPPATEKAIKEYLKARGSVGEDEPLFTSCSHHNSGGRLATGSVSRIVKTALVKAGLISEKMTAHSLRHTAVTEALKAGATPQEVQDFARHSSINTTLIYAHNLEKEKNPCSKLIAKAILSR